MNVFKKYPFVKQNGIKDCAAASLLMIIKYYNGYINMETLSDMLETDKNGTTAYNIIKVSTQIGFEAKGIKTSFDKINKDNMILPCIAHVTLNETYQHYIVIYSINFKSRTLIIGDPQDKIKKLTFNEFEKIWNNILIVLYPKTPIIRNNNNSLYEYLYSIVKKYKKELLQILIISFVLTCFSIISSFYFKYIIDSLTYPKKYMFLIFFLFLMTYLFRMTTDFCRNRLLIFFNQKLELEINLGIFKQVLSLPYHYYRNRTTGEIITRISNLDNVRDMISKVFLSLFIDIPLSLISMIILYCINTKLFFITIIILALYVLIVIIFRNPLNKSIVKAQNDKAIVNSYMVESLNGFETVKGLDIIEYIQTKHEKKYIEYLKSVFSLQKTYTNQLFLKDIVNTLGQAIVIFIGSLFVIDKQLSLGTLLTFNTILAYFLDPIKNVIDLDYIIKEAKISLKKVLDMIEIEKNNGLLKTSVKGNIRINNLSLQLNNKNIINIINLTIKEGDKVMITGKSGSGKSTLLKILMKYYSINRGQLFIDDTDYNDYKKAEGIKYISQQEILFTDTLYNNISLGNNDINKFLEIAKICQIDEIVKNNTTGYNMLIEENGFNISGGQKQRIILARSIMQKFNILLIDEGLNQMDINLERQILKSMFKKFADKTIIIISHRLENMDLYDQVIEINKGKVTKDLTKNVRY